MNHFYEMSSFLYAEDLMNHISNNKKKPKLNENSIMQMNWKYVTSNEHVS